MSALEDIRSALKTALSGASGLSAYAVVPGQVNPPAAVVAPQGVEYNSDFDGGATYTIPVQVVVSLGDWGTAQRQLDGYIAHDGSAVDAIHAADSIEARVLRMEEYGLTQFGGVDYLGAVLLVEVLI